MRKLGAEEGAREGENERTREVMGTPRARTRKERDEEKESGAAAKGGR